MKLFLRVNTRLVSEELRRSAAAKMRARMEAAAMRAPQIGREIAERTYIQRNRPSRRRSPGRIHYHNAFRATVRGDDFPLSVELRNIAPHAEYLEHGTPPHTIRAGVSIPGGRSEHLGYNGVTAIDMFGDPSGAKTKPRNPVNHPGQKGTHIVERALAKALREQGFRRPDVRG